MSTRRLHSLPIESIVPSAYQPRRDFDAVALEELAASIRKQGLVQPIVVRPDGTGGYELIAGERRWRATQLAGLTEIDALVAPYTDQQCAELALTENLQREDLNPIEEAEGFRRLIEDFGLTHEDVAIALGKSRTVITNALRLLTLEASVQQLLREGKLSAGHGKVLAGIGVAQQRVIGARAAREGWAVRKLERFLQELLAKDKPAVRKDAHLKRLEAAIADALGNAVHLDWNEADGKGRLEIRFHSADEFDGILERLGLEVGV